MSFPKACYHTHNEFCDGAEGPEAYLREAERRGFAALGFTSHAPLPFENEWTLSDGDLGSYLETIRSLKGSSPVEVYLGLEIDYIPGAMGPAEERWRGLGLDYTVGSVHMLESEGSWYSIDGPDDEFLHLLNTVYAGDGSALAAAYYAVLAEMVDAGGATIAGHIDLIRKKNDRFNFLDEGDPVYRSALLSVLDRLRGSGIIMEINSGGVFRGATTTVYPSEWVLRAACERDIPVIINADAHTPEAIEFHYAESQELARRCGYREAMLLLEGRWRAFPL